MNPLVRYFSICIFIYFYCTNASNSSSTSITSSSSIHDNDNRKIAFLFITRGPMPLEDIWREFFNWNANESHYSIYIHPSDRSYMYPSTSMFYRKEVKNRAAVSWGGAVGAIRILLTEALLDPLNEWFCTLSESCIPVIPFHTWRNVLLSNSLSIINAKPHHIASSMEGNTRWRPSLDGLFDKKYWRKSATWFALTRKHAVICQKEYNFTTAWLDVPIADEHYYPSLLASFHLDNETTGSDGYVHVYWKSLSDSHPYLYYSDDIDSILLKESLHTVSHHLGNSEGFGGSCSGFEVCHFSARKFRGTSKFTLLSNIHHMLSYRDDAYTGNPYTLYHTLLRHSAEKLDNTNTNSVDGAESLVYYLIDGGLKHLRRIPDASTLFCMNMLSQYSSELTKTEMDEYKVGNPYVSRADGQFMKRPKHQVVFYVMNCTRHAIPDMDTFFALGATSIDQIMIVSDDHIDQIPIGLPVEKMDYGTLHL